MIWWSPCCEMQKRWWRVPIPHCYTSTHPGNYFQFVSSSKLLFNNWSVIPHSYTFIHHDFFNPWQSALINMFRIVTRWEIKSIVPHCYKHSCLSSFDNFVIIHDLWFCIGLDTGWFILPPPHISTKKKTAKQAIIAAVPVNPVLFLTAWRFSFWYWNLGGS